MLRKSDAILIIDEKKESLVFINKKFGAKYFDSWRNFSFYAITHSMVTNFYYISLEILSSAVYFFIQFKY